MIVNYWPAWFRALYGGEWPVNYCTFDLETTGYSMERDVIVEWGHCLVQDGEPVDRLSLIIDWTNHPILPDHWLRQRLQQVASSMAANGSKCHVTYERMKKEGVKPDKALPFILKFIRTLAERDSLFVAHGGYAFDEKMLASNFRGFGIAQDFTFGDNNLFDTDCVEKASQVVTHPRMHPRKGDTLRSYFHRVKYTRMAGVKSNLDTHCYEKYFKQKGVQKCDMHGALTDAHCCHLMMECWREQITGEHLAPPVGGEEAPSGNGKKPPPSPYPAPPRPAKAATVPVRRRGQRNN